MTQEIKVIVRFPEMENLNPEKVEWRAINFNLIESFDHSFNLDTREFSFGSEVDAERSVEDLKLMISTTSFQYYQKTIRFELVNIKEEAGIYSEKSTIEAENVLKIVDVWYDKVSEETIKMLTEHHMVYRDQNLSMNEHIVDVTQAIEQDSGAGYPGIEKDLTELMKLINEHDAGYVRFVRI